MENEKETKEETKEETEENLKIKGTVAWFNEGKGYGFIVADGKEYFVHFSEIITDKDFKMLYEAEKVEFIPEKDKQGRDRATNVVKIEKSKK